MWTATCLLVGIAGIIFAVNLPDSKNREVIGLLIFSGALILLSFTLDPVGFIERQLRDERPYNSQGAPNYWANIQTGELIHKLDPEVEACAKRTRLVETGWGSMRTCDVFGTGLLIEAAGATRQVAEAIQAYKGNRSAVVVKPGAMFTVDESWFTFQRGGSRCVQVYAVLRGGNQVIGTNGIEYQVNGGEWFLADENGPSGRGAFFDTYQLNIRTPDALPRVVYFKVGVIRTPNQPPIAAPSFCF